jgi:serine protease AprX
MKRQMKAIIPFILGAALISAVPCLVGADGGRPASLPPLSAMDPENVIHMVEIGDDGRTIRHVRQAILDSAFAEEKSDVDPPRHPGPVREKIHHVLEQMVEEEDPELRVEVFVNLADNSPVPRFPDPPLGHAADSRAAAQFQAASTEIVHDLLAHLRRSTATLRARLAARGIRIDVVDQLWLLNGFVAHVRLGDIPELAGTDAVLHVQPNFLATHSRPPVHESDDLPHGDVALGRQRIGSDAYAALPGMDQGRIGLLDTGVNAHVLLGPPPGGNLGANGDCVAGGLLCSTLGASDSFNTFDCHDHGTASAAVLSGNDSFGNPLRGVTDILVDSWKVWFRAPPDCHNDGYVASAVVHALQAGLLLGSRVFAIVLQGDEPEHGATSSASNAAFHAGAVVVAANGNCAISSLCNQATGVPQPSTVRAPANAHAVIGVGAFNVVDLETRPYQGQGPTVDGRIKPDLQAPTDVRTAGAGHFFEIKERYGGTSAATPFAAGAAALMRNWLAKFDTFDPGQTYCRLILSGDRTWTPADDYSNVHGVGHLQLPELICRTAHWGKVTLWPARLRPGARRVIQVVNIPLEVKAGHREIVAALWWPGSPWQDHNNIDLRVLDPDGKVQAGGLSVHSVFERVRILAEWGSSLAPGTWTVQVRGTHLQSPPQTVYWTADLRGCLAAEPLPPSPEPPPVFR